MNRYLTKAIFKLATECPTKLFYTGKDQIYKNTKDEESILAMLAEGGFQVGELAKQYFPDGIEVETSVNSEALEETSKLLEKENVVIFEAAARYQDLFVRIDILIKEGNSFRLIEVKAKSYNSMKPEILGARGGISSGIRPYIEDVAFQAYVLRSANPKTTVKTFLMMPDKSVSVTHSGLNQLFKIKREGKRSKVIPSKDLEKIDLDRNILAIVPVDDYVEMINRDGVHYLRYIDSLPQLAEKWAQAYKLDVKIPPDPGVQCGKCEFNSNSNDQLKSGFKECWSEKYKFTESDFNKGTVLDIFRFRRKDKLISDGRVLISSIAPDDIVVKEDGDKLTLSRRQMLQVCGIPIEEDRGGYWISEKLLRREIANWKFPYHFIDFETSTVALPFHAGMKPYEPVAFQYSHHVMHADGRVEHAGQFLLTDPGVFPNFKFAEKLKEELGQDIGTVFMWSGHENTILTKIIEQLQNSSSPPKNAGEIIEFLKTLVKDGKRAMYDLCQLSRDAYYHIDTKGSSSIKKVLPSILKISAALKQKYNKPIYGSTTGIPSKNYNNFTWWVSSANGNPVDPYEFLKKFNKTIYGEDEEPSDDDEEIAIAEGGAAATAYSRLQFEDINLQDREKINEALLRYCELDTLAMVIIVEGWLDKLNTFIPQFIKINENIN